MDSTELTNKNHEIAREFSDPTSGLAEGVLLTGSNAWGANYAVRKDSDIDLVVVTKDLSSIGKIIDDYVEKGLVDGDQRVRFETFLKLKQEDRADTLSFKTNYKDTTVGVDFFTRDIVDDLVNMAPVGVVCSGSTKLRTLREFRSNKPKMDGYTVDSFSTSKSLIYHPKFEQVEDGYIQNTLVDGWDDEYLLGVYSFFFSIEPKMMLDGVLKYKVGKFQNQIKKQLKGRQFLNVTRKERMSMELFRKIKGLLSGS